MKDATVRTSVTAINVFRKSPVFSRTPFGATAQGQRGRARIVSVMKQFFAVLYSPGKNWVEGKSIFEQPLDGHIAYVKSLSDDGTVLMAGPFLDDDAGLTILQADGLEEAGLIIAEDPDVREEVLRAQVRCWKPLRLDAEGSEYEEPPLLLSRALEPSSRGS
jgi:uncharacterized protein YciI